MFCWTFFPGAAPSGDYTGRIVDLVETSPGHQRTLLGRAIQIVRIAGRDRSHRIEPSDLVIAQRDRGGEVIVVPVCGFQQTASVIATFILFSLQATSFQLAAQAA